MLEDLINQVPKTAYYAQKQPIQLRNWLPFYWKGFKQTTRYTYQIKQPIHLDETFANFKSNTRNEVNKAKKKSNYI